jgi:alkylation response protein AidB-like acyl-CoA dehydrogenase
VPERLPAVELGPAAAELREFLAEAMPRFRRQFPDDSSWEAKLAWQRRLDEGGWVAPAWPEEYGGRGLAPVERVQCDAEFARAGAPELAGILGINNVGPTLIAWGSDEQKQHLARIRSTEELWCQGFSEPEAGSDLAALRMRAELRGDHFVVNGQKVWTSYGDIATHCMLLVRTDPATGTGSGSKHQGISVLLVPLDLPGIERRPLRQMTGQADFAELFFTDVVVPTSALLGPLHEGWRVTMTTLGYERAGTIAMAAKLEHDVLATVEALGGGAMDPHLREELIDRYIEARLLGLLGQRALAKLAADDPPGPEQSLIKFAWSRASQRIGETELAAAGSYGLLADHDPQATLHFLRARSSTIAAGTTEVMRNILAERVLGLPKG